MTRDREFNRIRWHGRVGFLATTLSVLVCLGGPVLGTRGMLEHGALFLPVLVGMIYLFGAPLMRLALATGQMNITTPGEEALKPVQGVIRFAFVGVLLLVATHAGTWLLASMADEVPDRVAQMQRVEVAPWNGLWRLDSAWFLPAIGVVLLMAAMFWATVRRRGLAGLSWLGVPILVFFLLVVAGGLVMVAGVPRFGALVALAVPVKLDSLFTFSFWGDAGSVALVAVGAQTGVVVAAGRGLPQRAKVGRESRLLVCFMALITVVGTLAALFLICAMDLQLGLAPVPEHAAPHAMLIDLVPAASEFMVSGMPENIRPSPAVLTRVWCLAVFMVSTFGMLALAVSGGWFPKRKLERPALFGYTAAAVLIIVLVLNPGSKEVWAMLAVAPALLAVMRMTLARRHGMGMKLAATAFESTKGWLSRFYLFVAFRISRQLLLLMVLAVVFSNRSQGFVYAGLALAFLLMWIGSLQMRRLESTRITRVIPKVAILLCLGGTVYATDLPAPLPFTEQVVKARTDAARKAVVADVISRRVALDSTEKEMLLRQLTELRELVESGQLNESDTVQARQSMRSILWVLQADSPNDVDLLLPEREALEMDQIAPFTRVSEALIALDAGDRKSVERWANKAATNWNSARIRNAGRDETAQEFAFTLTGELQQQYGPWGSGSRQLRLYLLDFAVNGRSLLKPSVGAGLTMILTLLGAAAMLVSSMLLGIRRPRSVDLDAKTD
ncbi:hypothetical protein OAU50_01335 [Planctomycetota bacterium]|nr:hypothetical protein [Planctomycetota bacterium]